MNDHETHSACEEQLKKLGGKAPCCSCSGHDCKPTEASVKESEPMQSGCVQCHQEMEEYNVIPKTIYVKIGDGTAVRRSNVFRCTKPECPNFNLLQGEL